MSAKIGRPAHPVSLGLHDDALRAAVGIETTEALADRLNCTRQTIMRRAKAIGLRFNRRTPEFRENCRLRWAQRRSAEVAE